MAVITPHQISEGGLRSQHRFPSLVLHKMGSRRGLHPAAGVLLGLGTGCVVVALGDADSKTRRQILTRASAIRREVLVTALSKRLQGACATTRAAPAVAAAPARGGGGRGGGATEAPCHRFHVVTGPDAHLTSLARDRVSQGLLGNNNCSSDNDSVISLSGTYAGFHVSSNRSDEEEVEDAMAADDNRTSLSSSPSLLAVPYDCKLGTGLLSSLVEQQLLRRPQSTLIAGAGDGRELEQRQHQHQHQHQQKQHQPQQQSYGSTGWKPELQERWDQLERDSDDDESSPSPSTATAIRVMPPPAPLVSTWESLVLWATLVVLDGEELDNAAVWALERVLSDVPCCSDRAESLRIDDDEDDDNNDSREGLAPSPSDLASPTLLYSSAPNVNERANFVLEIGRPAASQQEDGQKGDTRDSLTSGALCGDLARWGWRLASRGLGSVVLRYVLYESCFLSLLGIIV